MTKWTSLAFLAAAFRASHVYGAVGTIVPGLDAWHLDNLYALAVEQLDPIVSPNAQSSHMHRILGGSNFAAAYNAEELEASSCTTAAVTVDHSAYWAPQLYWIVNPEHPDNTTFLQLTSFNRFYYFLGRNDPSEPVQAWPSGFKMVAGSPTAKTPNKMYTYYCHRKPDLSDEISSGHFNFDDPCLGGIKFDLSFPSCWDGINLYKSDQSHMAYPTYNLREGPCPASHPVRLPSILLEYTYHPEVYPAITKGQNMRGHLAWANGDTTGYGLHADFMMGWDRDILTKALNDPRCVTINHAIPITECPVLNDYFNINAAKACKPARGQLMEPYPQGDGNIVPKLPGCNSLWGVTGEKPGCNTPVPALDISAHVTTAGPDILPVSQQRNTTIPDSKGWHNIGCYHNPALTPKMAFVDPKLTPERCQDACQRNGYSYAAVTMTGGARCFCDSALNMNAGIMLSGCNVLCPAGDKTCGGEYKLDIYYQAPRHITPDTHSSDLGCYKLPADWAADSMIRTALHTFTDRSMTQEKCFAACAEKGAKYSAIRDNTCYCGAAFQTGPGFFAPSEMCSRPCGGNSSQTCGDYYAMSVFNLKPMPKPVDEVLYRGCVADGTPRVLNATWTFSRTGMTPDFCANIARKAGKKVFGVEYGTDCFVGDALLKTSATSKCNTACSGDNSLICGGPWALSVFEIVPMGETPSIDIPTFPNATIVTSITSSATASLPNSTLSAFPIIPLNSSSIATNPAVTAYPKTSTSNALSTSRSTQPASSSLAIPTESSAPATVTKSPGSTTPESTSIAEASVLTSTTSSLPTNATEALVSATSEAVNTTTSTKEITATTVITSPSADATPLPSADSTSQVTEASPTDPASSAAISASASPSSIPDISISPEPTISMSEIQQSSSASAIESPSSTVSSALALPTESTEMPLPYVHVGCIADSSSARALNSTWTWSRTQMTPEFCYKIAKQFGKKLFGVEYGTDCFIGDVLSSNKTMTGCITPCSGDKDTICGGPYRLSLFSVVEEMPASLEESGRGKRFLEVQRRRHGQRSYS